MTEKNKNLVARVISALAALPVVLYLLWAGGWQTALLLSSAAAVCAGEYYAMTLRGLPPVSWVGIAGAAVLPALPVFAPGRSYEIGFWIVVFMWFIAWNWHLLRAPDGDAPARSAHLVSGLIYGSVGMMAVAALRTFPDGLRWSLVALVITWCNDTFAYFAGRLFGKHKLYPEVSPNKTWEGFAGGMAGNVFGMFVLRHWFPALSVTDCVALGVAGGIMGPAGDLCESMLKRATGVKDSGKVLPGHGGLLDRVDALSFNAPLVYLYARLVHGIT